VSVRAILDLDQNRAEHAPYHVSIDCIREDTMGRIILAAITFIAMCAVTASAIGAFAEEAVTSAPAVVSSAG
jgi:hypothetical protein